MKNLYHKILKKIAYFQVEHPILTLMFIVVFLVLMYGGVIQVKTVASLENMMPRDVSEIKAFNDLRDSGMGQDVIAVVLELDYDSENINRINSVSNYEVYEYLYDLSLSLKSETDVLKVYSMSNLFGNVKISEDQYYSYKKDVSKHVMYSNYVNDDDSIAILMILSDVAVDDERMKGLVATVENKIDEMGHPAGIDVKLTGTPIIQQKLGELVESDKSSTQWISTLFVFIITMIIFGTFTSAIVPILVVTLSVNFLYGTMGYNNLPISTLAGGVAAMVIGIGIDFAIHIMNKFKLERKKGYSIKKSVELAIVETGTALVATSFTTLAAFLAFLVGRMPEMGRFGILMAIGIAYSLFFSFIGLPAILVLEEKVIYYFRKKMSFGVEGEFELRKKSDNNKSDTVKGKLSEKKDRGGKSD
jgi:predicted RND superfamily exporter protein